MIKEQSLKDLFTNITDGDLGYLYQLTRKRMDNDDPYEYAVLTQLIGWYAYNTFKAEYKRAPKDSEIESSMLNFQNAVLITMKDKTKASLLEHNGKKLTELIMGVYNVRI